MYKQFSFFDYLKPERMNILCACEESQAVCSAFRDLGHNAFSCDIVDCSGLHPEWHIKQDVLPLLDGFCSFYTLDGFYHEINSKWDMIIAFPPCTYLTVSGNRWFDSSFGASAVLRHSRRLSAISFFLAFTMADCDHIAIENPIGIMSTYYCKPSQIIQPYFFGDPVRKSTCLWLKNLPLLVPTKIVEPELIQLKNGEWDSLWHYETFALKSSERSLIRSKTFPGIAHAMADQWGDVFFNN